MSSESVFGEESAAAEQPKPTTERPPQEKKKTERKGPLRFMDLSVDIKTLIIQHVRTDRGDKRLLD
jgi:hypothetical protein